MNNTSILNFKRGTDSTKLQADPFKMVECMGGRKKQIEANEARGSVFFSFSPSSRRSFISLAVIQSHYTRHCDLLRVPLAKDTKNQDSF